MRFLRSRRVGALLLAAPAFLSLSPAAAQSGAPAPAFPSQYLGAVDLSEAPHSADVADALGPTVPFGGVSGLERVGAEDYVALSDDSAQHGPARAYRMSIPSDPASGTRPTVTGATILRDPSGRPYAPQTMDPESVRRLPGGDFAWTSEGWAKEGNFCSPAVILSDASGKEIRRLSVPSYHAPDSEGTRGVRHNKANEGLAVLGEDALITANEGTLVQDGPMNSEERGMRVRLTHYALDTGQPLAEYPLEVGALYPGARDRGVSEIIAGEDGSLYVIERGYVPGRGNRGEIYRVTLDGATNVLGKEALDGSETPARKELVFDFASLPEHPDNIEALAWAPRLADGRAQLLVASDDNFSDKQRTLLHRIALG